MVKVMVSAVRTFSPQTVEQWHSSTALQECGLVWTSGQDCARELTERRLCVLRERELIKRTRVCLTDTEGSLSSNNNSLMKVCVCKGIRVAVVMNHETHQSCVIDQIPNTRLTEINTAAM